MHSMTLTYLKAAFELCGTTKSRTCCRNASIEPFEWFDHHLKSKMTSVSAFKKRHFFKSELLNFVDTFMQVTAFMETCRVG